MRKLGWGQHCKPLLYIVGMWVILFGVLLLVVHFSLHERLLFSEWWCSSCLVFCLAWWTVYVLSRYINRHFGIKLQTINDFLNKVSTLREGIEVNKLTKEEVKGVNEAIERKSIAAPSTVGLLMATITLFFAVISRWTSPVDNFQQGLRLLAYAIGGLSIMFLLMSVEVFNTAANLFRPRETDHQQADVEIKRYFYGGASQSLYSCAYPAFMLFLIISLSFINPFIAGIAVAAFAWLGYRYWWGGWVEVDNSHQPYTIKEVGEYCLIGRTLGGVIGGGTILFWCLTTWCPLFANLAW